MASPHNLCTEKSFCNDVHAFFFPEEDWEKLEEDEELWQCFWKEEEKGPRPEPQKRTQA